MNSLYCQGISKAFDGVQALRDVDLSFPTSGIVALIGPNGAGKTTLLNVVTGLLRPDSGRVVLNEQNITHLQTHQVARLGIARTFQDLRLVRQVSVVENVLFARPHQKGERVLPALFRYGIAREEVKNRDEALRWLRFVGLTDQENQLAGEISYGQQKLLALACCLATDAKMLFLDEPVAGVHPKAVGHILGLLRELSNLGKLVVFIEHDLFSVREISDLVIAMDDGKVIAQGHPSEILDRPEIIDAYVS